MIYSFIDFSKVQSLELSILFIYSEHNLFKNKIIDAQREACRGVLSTVKMNKAEDLLSEFSNFGDYESGGVVNSMEFDDFYNVAYTPSLLGKWFCSVNYEDLDKRQLEKLGRYIRNPSKEGVLILSVSNYRSYLELRRNKILETSMYTSIINLRYPTRGELREIVQGMFNSRGIAIERDAIDLFIKRVGREYDSYPSLIDRFSIKRYKGVTYRDILDILQDVDNYEIGDIIVELTKVAKVNKKTNRQIYKVLKSLLNSYTPRELLRRLHYKIGEVLEMRMYINSGYIPAEFTYSVEEVQKRISKASPRSRLVSLSPHTFNELKKLSMRTTLRDWVIIYELTAVFERRGGVLESYSIIHLLMNRDLYTREELEMRMQFYLGNR